MISLRPSAARGHAERGWLESWHSFSFADFHDPKWMGFGDLRVINEDIVVPTAGFPAHAHRDMEIITYLLGGSIAHRDDTGGNSVLRDGEIQVMHAGRGIRHSEMNPSTTEVTHLLQIWIEPKVGGVAPGYQQGALDADQLRRGFTCVAAPHDQLEEAAPFRIYQDARLWIAWPAAAQALSQTLDAGRLYYLHVARGEVRLGETLLKAGDAALIKNERLLEVAAQTDAELLLFDLAAH